MAVSLNSNATLSCLHSQTTAHTHPSRSCKTMDYVGLKLQSPNSLGFAKPNLNVEFHKTVHKCIVSRTSKATLAHVKMMPIGTPRVPYRTPGEGSWQWVDLWNALYRERVIFIRQYIDEEFSNQMLATMLYLDSIDNSKRMTLYLNCPGGDLTPSLALYDTMQSLESPVATHCLGYANNLAGFILAAGEKGRRSVMPLARIAIQPPAGSARGQSDDISNETKELSRIRDYLYKEMAEKTGQPLEKIYEDFSRIRRFDAPEALEYGLIDRIVRPRHIREDPPRKVR
ncbi:hypothetical protein LguiA_015546 [Lonicera macranthoides]